MKNIYFIILDNLLKKTDTTPLETAREWEMEMELQELQRFADVSHETLLLHFQVPLEDTQYIKCLFLFRCLNQEIARIPSKWTFRR